MTVLKEHIMSEGSVLPGSLVAVRPGPDGQVATFERADSPGRVVFVDKNTLAITVCNGYDRFGRRMTMALVVQSMLVWMYNTDLKEVS